MRLKYIAIATALALMGIFLYKMVEISDYCGYRLSSSEVRELTPIAEGGDKDACSRLHFHYFEVGNKEKSYYWLRKGITYGDPHAMIFLLQIYKDLDPKDKQEVVIMLEKVAADNDPYAQYHMGQMYRDGDVVDRDLTKAEYWFRKSANNGDRHSMTYLSELLAMSGKKKTELVEAYKWTLIAQSRIDPRSPLGRQLTQDQIIIKRNAETLGYNITAIERAAQSAMQAEEKNIPKYKVPKVAFGSRACKLEDIEYP